MSESLRAVATTPSRKAALTFVLLLGNRSHREAEIPSNPTGECSGFSNRAMTLCRGVV